MYNYRTLFTPDGFIHAVSTSKWATSAMVLVLAIPSLQCMLLIPGTDLTLDIQGWSGLQNRWNVDCLSRNSHVFGIVTLDRLNVSPGKCGHLLMQFWNPRKEFSCLPS